MNPVVSVILTAHNYGRFLGQCIRGVLDQTFRDFELIIVNDGSTDDTAEMAARYAGDPWVRILTPPGVGLAAVCNRGIREAHGQFILRLDADDFLAPRSLIIEVEILRNHPEIGLVYPDHHTVDERGILTGTVCLPQVQEGARLLDSNPPPGAAMFRFSCYDALGCFDETLRCQEDFDFWLRLTERFRAHGVGIPLLFYRRYGGSMSGNRAPRAAARRYVKRRFAETRRLLADERIGLVIPTTWPGAPVRWEDLLCQDLGGTPMIELVVQQVRTTAAIDRLFVVIDHGKVSDALKNAGAEVLSGRAWAGEPGEQGVRAETTWLCGLVKAIRESCSPVPTVLVLASPYCLLRHPDWVQEIVDTLAIHRCDLVVAVNEEPVHVWGTGATGLVPLSATGRVYREAGELIAVRTSWLDAGRPFTDVRVGYVELLYPEWWCFGDEGGLETGRWLLPQAAALRLNASVYLRTVG